MLRRAALLACCGLVLLSALGLALAELPPPISDYQAGRARWSQLQARHYQLEMLFQSQWRTSHLLLEVRNEQIVGGIDLRSGAQLSAGEIATQSLWLPVNRMFDRMLSLGQREPTWQERVSTLSPWLARQLRVCRDPPPRIRYHPTLGYPATLRFMQNLCSTPGEVEVLISVMVLP